MEEKKSTGVDSYKNLNSALMIRLKQKACRLPGILFCNLQFHFKKKKLPRGTDALKRLKSSEPPETMGGNKRIIIKKNNQCTHVH